MKDLSLQGGLAHPYLVTACYAMGEPKLQDVRLFHPLLHAGLSRRTKIPISLKIPINPQPDARLNTGGFRQVIRRIHFGTCCMRTTTAVLVASELRLERTVPDPLPN
jgi:hypothetical protein